MHYMIIALGWVLWCALHSVMIASGTTAFLRRTLGRGFRFYRLCYAVIAALTLVPVLAFTRAAGGPALFSWNGPLRVLQALSALTALALFVAGARHYDVWRLLGIRQIPERTSRGGLAEGGGFDRTGVLSVIRHPWYAGGILALWARDIDAGTLVMNLVLTAYLIIGSVLEERKLVGEFGEEYASYQREVSMLVPVRWLRWKFRNGKSPSRRQRA